MEKADKEKALNQVAEASLNEKTLEMNVVEQQTTTIEMAWELAEQKVEDLQCMLSKTEVELTEAASLVFARDKELADLKNTMKTWKQTYYNKGFRDAENLAGPVIFQAQKFGFMEGWMVVVNAIGLPDTSPFRSADQISLPEDLEVKAQAQEQSEDNSEEDEGAESPEMRELSHQIDSHMVLLDEDNLATTTLSVTQGATQPALSSDPLVNNEAPLIGPVTPNNPNT